jgi:hypothetical protein
MFAGGRHRSMHIGTTVAEIPVWRTKSVGQFLAANPLTVGAGSILGGLCRNVGIHPDDSAPTRQGHGMRPVFGALFSLMCFVWTFTVSSVMKRRLDEKHNLSWYPTKARSPCLPSRTGPEGITERKECAHWLTSSADSGPVRKGTGIGPVPEVEALWCSYAFSSRW